MGALRILLLSTLLLILTTASCSRSDGDQPTAEYDPKTGRLQAFTFDANGNGRNDAVSYMDGTRIRRIEIDFDEDGVVDRWDFYANDRKLDKVGLSRRKDGVMDAEAFYYSNGFLSHIRISPKRDGRYSLTEFYEDNRLVRSEEDTNGDGRPDKWDGYRAEPGAALDAPPYVITSTAIDETGEGRPTRRFVYGAGGAVTRVEVDPDGDGAFTVVSD